jgi:hypothetical protein
VPNLPEHRKETSKSLDGPGTVDSCLAVIITCYHQETVDSGSEAFHVKTVTLGSISGLRISCAGHVS